MFILPNVPRFQGLVAQIEYSPLEVLLKRTPKRWFTEKSWYQSGSINTFLSKWCARSLICARYLLGVILLQTSRLAMLPGAHPKRRCWKFRGLISALRMALA